MVSTLLLAMVSVITLANDRSKNPVSPGAGRVEKESEKIISEKGAEILFTRWPLVQKKRRVSSSETIRSRATRVVADERIDPTSLISSSSLAARPRVDVDVEWLADVVQSWEQLIKRRRSIHLHKAKGSRLEQTPQILDSHAWWFW